MGRILLPENSIFNFFSPLQNLQPKGQISSKLFNSLGHLCVLQSKQNFTSRIAMFVVAIIVLKLSRIS